MKTLTNCPVCSETSTTPFLSCTDYTVSKENFSIVECSNCGFRYTNPIPLLTELGSYYESEDYISHSNTSKDLISKIYQRARKIALQNKYNIVSSRVQGKNLLDIGSGTGEFLHFSKSNGLIVKGIEPSLAARNSAIRAYNLEIFEEEKLQQWEDESFDIITLWHVLEHVYDLKERIKEIKRLLKKDGKIFIAVPNCAAYDAVYYKDYWAAYDVPRHLYHFRKEQMQILWEKIGCTIEEILPMKMDSYYVSLLSEKYKGSGFLSYFKGFIHGLRSNMKAQKSGEWSSLIYVISKT